MTISAQDETIRDGSVIAWLWEGLSQADPDGSPVQFAEHSDRSVQVIGTFDGATITLQGSNDGVTWAPLTDPLGNVAAFTAAGLKQITEITREIRPLATGAGASTDVDVHLLMSRPAPMRT